MRVSNDFGSSEASIELGDHASADYVASEDVETLFDSNLADVPMVFTVAGQQALSIDARPSIDIVPFGVACSSNEEVEVNIELAPLTSPPSPLYVFDAVLGTTTAVNDGDTFSIQPNDYGRYFLTTTDMMDGKMDNDIVINIRSGVVTVTAKSAIGNVRAVGMNGVTAYEQTNCGTTTSFCLQQGAYVIETDGFAGALTRKVIVK